MLDYRDYDISTISCFSVHTTSINLLCSDPFNVKLLNKSTSSGQVNVKKPQHITPFQSSRSQFHPTQDTMRYALQFVGAAM